MYRQCHVMAKPGGSKCNIYCKYCFYREKQALYPHRKQNWRMSEETLEEYVKQHIAAQHDKPVIFSWQGGEPMLLGLPFFQHAIRLCDKYGKGREIHHTLQTNGILLNEKWAAFLSQHRFMVGLSLDGPETLHDRYRVSRSGQGSHRSVMQGLSLLRRFEVDFNTLTVVGRHNVSYAREVYEFLRGCGSRYMQFIPLVERITTDSGGPLKLVTPDTQKARLTPWTVPSLRYGEFLSQIFDIWIRRDIDQIVVQMFDVALAAWTRQSPVLCVHTESCGHAFALEANGDLYNCDHYVYPEYLLGNIHQHSIDAMNNSESAIAFGHAKKLTLTADCKSCHFRFVCHGGCPKHRFILSPSGCNGHNYLCAGYQHFFKHIQPVMNLWASLLARGCPPSQLKQHLRHQHSLMQYRSGTRLN
ncbi:anaerobic sulfatase maturase [Enterobacter sp. UPMP2052]